MSLLRDGFLDRIVYLYGHKRFPQVFVETGTYHGKTAAAMGHRFNEVHTIELSDLWYQKSVDLLKNQTNVMCHLGDSSDCLDELLQNLKRPAFFYLDAHYSGADTAFGLEEVPLLRELKVLRARTQKDIIVIDDLRLIGKKGISGEANHPFYPLMEFDWTTISRTAIREAVIQTRVYWKETDDRIVIFTNLSLTDLVLTKTRSLVLWTKGQYSLWNHRADVARTVGRTEPLLERLRLLLKLWNGRSRRLRLRKAQSR